MLKIYIHFNDLSKSYAKLGQGRDNRCHIKSSVSIQKLQLENNDTKKKNKKQKEENQRRKLRKSEREKWQPYARQCL